MVAEGAISSGFIGNLNPDSNPPAVAKKKRNLPGNPDPEAEVIVLSPKTLMATNRFTCEICGKGFQRDQNLQLHRRGHNLPWKLKQREDKENTRKRVYVCPETTCVHNHPSRALGDLTGIKKHFSRKHGEKKYKCDKCSKIYAVHSDWKAHSKTCGTREYRCDCGSVFSRRDSFITHRAFCDALAEETARLNATAQLVSNNINLNYHNLMGTPFVLGPDMSHHKPLFSSNDAIWSIGQGLQPQDAITNTSANLQEIHHQLGLLNSRSLLINNDPLIAGSNPPSSEYLHPLNWVFWKKNLSSSSGNTEEFIMTTSSPQLSNSANKEALSLPSLYSKQHLSIPSLYSKQDQITNHQEESIANNSATALLQKAAQIGSTSSDPRFSMSFGLKSSNVNCNPPDHDGNNYWDLLGSTSLVTSLGSDHDTENSTNEISAFNQMQTQPAKRRRVENGEGQTRDFLGVGVESICNTTSIAGWISSHELRTNDE